VRACISILLETREVFFGNQKEDDRRPLSVNSPMFLAVVVGSCDCVVIMSAVVHL
jgi:hypothetical protein